jgi:hypothetical protein
MRSDEDPLKLTGTGTRPRATLSGLIGKVLAFAAGALFLIGAFMLSLLLFAVVVSVGLVVWGYLWWRTRELRKLVGERLRTADTTWPRDGASVIEGDFVREPERDRR